MPRIIASLLILAGFVAGFLFSATRFGLSRAEAASGSDQRWAYFCFDSQETKDINAKANAAGLRGWEMVTASQTAEGNSVWCFKRRNHD
jgi:hypothetical protein